jgi:hypothetical protein
MHSLHRYPTDIYGTRDLHSDWPVDTIRVCLVDLPGMLREVLIQALGSDPAVRLSVGCFERLPQRLAARGFDVVLGGWSSEEGERIAATLLPLHPRLLVLLIPGPEPGFSLHSTHGVQRFPADTSTEQLLESIRLHWLRRDPA